MLILMNPTATEAQIDGVVGLIESLGLQPHVMGGSVHTAIGISGDTQALDRSRFQSMAGVAEAIRVSKPYKLTSLEAHPERTVVSVDGASIGGAALALIAGPCSIEDRAQAFAVAEAVKKSGAQFFRGGAFKPRSSPYSFHGLGEEGLKILAEVREKFGLNIVTEALDEENVSLVEKYADMIQVGSRNMQNFSLLRRVGRSRLPVLLKRGMAATLEEWLLAAEYIMAEGNGNVVLCERGVRTFAQHSRNTLDLAAVPAVRRISHLPVIVDASHGTGRNYMVAPLARAGVAAGADGLMIEVHCKPQEALSDGAQALTLEEFAKMANEVRAIREVIS
jgi:3-deoxy-7-phosphoheptulonate synthase